MAGGKAACWVSGNSPGMADHNQKNLSNACIKEFSSFFTLPNLAQRIHVDKIHSPSGKFDTHTYMYVYIYTHVCAQQHAQTNGEVEMESAYGAADILKCWGGRVDVSLSAQTHL
jgi:hypothetical protein